jgi:hypothetical protein
MYIKYVYFGSLKILWCMEVMWQLDNICWRKDTLFLQLVMMSWAVLGACRACLLEGQYVNNKYVRRLPAIFILTAMRTWNLTLQISKIKTENKQIYSWIVKYNVILFIHCHYILQYHDTYCWRGIFICWWKSILKKQIFQTHIVNFNFIFSENLKLWKELWVCFLSIQ